MISDNYLIWIDLEMTGLNSERDVIVEIATIITDNSLTVIAEGPSCIIYQPENILAGMDEWPRKQHTKSGLLDKIRSSQTTLKKAEHETLEFVRAHCTPQTAPLCGNSVYQDRAFLRKYMPTLNAFTHYRLIDVSSIKELVRRWYPNNTQAQFKKTDSHRALTDIQESIAELRHYKKYFFVDFPSVNT